MLGRAEKRGKQGIAVKAWPAQPVNRSVATDERGRPAIADQGVVLDLQWEVGSQRSPACCLRIGLRRARLDIVNSRSMGTVAGDDSVSILRHLWRQLAQNPSDDFLYRPTHVHDNWILVGVRLLQYCEVTVEDAW